MTGDSAEFNWGTGTFASRGAVVAGNAINASALAVRKKIFEIHLEARAQNPDKLDIEAAASAAEGFSGAEIEQA